jgi:hypothetical protein
MKGWQNTVWSERKWNEEEAGVGFYLHGCRPSRMEAPGGPHFPVAFA